jgi:hypothetical protein
MNFCAILLCIRLWKMSIVWALYNLKCKKSCIDPDQLLISTSKSNIYAKKITVGLVECKCIIN